MYKYLEGKKKENVLISWNIEKERKFINILKGKRKRKKMF